VGHNIYNNGEVWLKFKTYFRLFASLDSGVDGVSLGLISLVSGEHSLDLRHDLRAGDEVELVEGHLVRRVGIHNIYYNAQGGQKLKHKNKNLSKTQS
jgi:hypothetical protein